MLFASFLYYSQNNQHTYIELDFVIVLKLKQSIQNLALKQNRD